MQCCLSPRPMQPDLCFFHVLKLIWVFAKGARQTACPEEWNPSKRHGTDTAQLRRGELKIPVPPVSHPPLSVDYMRDQSQGTKISIMLPCLSVSCHLIHYYILNSNPLTSQSGTLREHKLQNTVLIVCSSKHQHKESLAHWTQSQTKKAMSMWIHEEGGMGRWGNTWKIV